MPSLSSKHRPDTTKRFERYDPQPLSKKGEAVTPYVETTALNFVTEALAFHLAEDNLSVPVITQRPDAATASRWYDGNVTVDEVPKSGGPFGFFKLALTIPRADRVVHLEHELYAYGGIITAFTVPLRFGHYAVADMQS